MCLNIKWWSVKKIALTDIVCYKNVSKDSQLTNVFKTPHRYALVRIGETYKSELVRDIDGLFGDHSIEEGLHSFIHLKDAQRRSAFLIVKCIIPRGSRYYSGRWGYNKKAEKCYASNRLKYVEFVT